MKIRNSSIPALIQKRVAPFWSKGIIAVCGNWEPILFLRRAGYAFVDEEEQYAREHEEALAKKMAQVGITGVIWHWYKGIGYTYEKEEMEHTRRFAGYCRKYGLTMGTYVNIGSVFAETFFQENPRARKWLTVDDQGRPHSYSEFYRAYYRYRPCMTQQPFVDYVKKMTRLAVTKANSQWIHFDNCAQMPCYCKTCHANFVAYLKRKYAPANSREKDLVKKRFGINDLNQILLPRGTPRMTIDSLPRLMDPVLQEWVEFRCSLLSSAIKSVVAYIKKDFPEVAFTANSPFQNGQFAPLVWGNDMEGIAPSVDFLFSEDDNVSQVTTDQRLITRIGTYKLGAALKCRIMVYHGDIRENFTQTLSIMETAVFNRGCLGCMGNARAILEEMDSNDPRFKTIQFVRKHQDLFTESRSMAEAAVLFSRSSMMLNWAQCFQSMKLMQQVLLQYGIQFDMVLENQLKDLSKYRVLILPNTMNLSTTSLSAIRQFLKQGGKVVASERTASFDDWSRVRFSEGKGVFGGEFDPRFGGSNGQCLEVCRLLSVFAIKKTTNNQIFYIPRLERTRIFAWQPDSPRVPYMDNSYWELPPNHKAIAEVILQALDQKPLVRKKSPSFVICQLAETARKNPLVLHLLNYDSKHIPSEVPVEITLQGIKKIEVLGLDKPSFSTVPFQRNKNGIKFQTAGFSLYQGFVLWR